MNQLKVFVSSTCYDLAQIRSDLFDFILESGFHPVLSEYNSFPIDPGNDTITNCIQNVETADIFILIVGNRYGNIIDNNKSITNTEYLYAKNSGIPTYIFIYKPLIQVLPIWKNNREADFSSTVDSTKVFEFVEELREKNQNWCFEFDKGQDIINTIRIQFSHLFKSSLDLRKRFKISIQTDFFKKLPPVAINTIIKKDELYEVKFFAQVLKAELEQHENLKNDLEYQILFGCNTRVEDIKQLLDWFSQSMETVNQFIQSCTTLFNVTFKHYYGEPGVPSDLKGLYYVANTLAKLYKEMVTWSLQIKSTYVEKDFELIRDYFSKITIDSAKKNLAVSR